MYKVEDIDHIDLETRCNELEAEGWSLVEMTVHLAQTESGNPILITVWMK